MHAASGFDAQLRDFLGQSNPFRVRGVLLSFLGLPVTSPATLVYAPDLRACIVRAFTRHRALLIQLSARTGRLWRYTISTAGREKERGRSVQGIWRTGCFARA